MRDSLDRMSENGKGEKIEEQRRGGREKVQENGGPGNFIFSSIKLSFKKIDLVLNCAPLHFSYILKIYF